MRFCSYPFKTVHLDPGGGVRQCAWLDVTIGNLKDNTLDEIWHSDGAEKVRESIQNQSFEFCREQSCPWLENDSLEKLSEEEFEKKAVTSKSPQDMSLAFDLRCNHACPSCRHEVYVPSEEYKNTTSMIADSVVPYINRAKNIITCGNGDLFASKDILRMLSSIEPDYEGFSITIETNGVLFTEKNWEKISHLGRYNVRVVVTPNSYQRDAYKYLSGGFDNLEQLEKNLLFIKRLRQEGIVNFFSLATVVQDRNFREVPAFIRKSFDIYNADEVIVKPVYKWFCMTEEEHWQRDVLNPLHPYHKEYLEIMKDPIFEDERVFLWGAKNLHPAKEHPAMKYRILLEIMSRILMIEDYQRKILEYVNNTKSKRVFCYGDNAVTLFINRILSNNHLDVRMMARDITEENTALFQSFKEYIPNEDDLVIITEFYNRKYIERDLKFLGYSGKIADIDELICSID